MLYLDPHIRQLMLEDAMQAFPDECCGFFYGEEINDKRYIKSMLIVENAQIGDKRRRFEISPKDYLRAEEYAEEQGLQLLGVYHSHPNSPAFPSEQDRQAAQPFFSYIIMSIYERGRNNLLSWRLNDQFQFESEEVLEASTIA